MILAEKRLKIKEYMESIKSTEKLIENLRAKESELKGEDLDKTLEEVKTHLKTLDTLKEKMDLMKEEVETEEKSLQLIADGQDMGGKKMSAETYLKTKQAFEDFCDIISEYAGKTLEQVNEAWKTHLGSKGITNPEILYPEPVIRAINDTFEMSGTIFSTFHKIWGVTVWAEGEFHSTDVGLGYQTGNDKKEQESSLTSKEIRCDFIYKYITIPKKVMKETGGRNGLLVQYVLKELPQRIVYAIERRAVIGDPVGTLSEDLITSYEPMVNAGVDYTVSIDSTGNLLEDIMQGDAELKLEGAKYLITTKQNLIQLRTLKNTVGDYIYGVPQMPMSKAQIADLLGVDDIFTPDWFTDAGTTGTPKAIMYVGRSYTVIGDQTIENFENFILKKNTTEFLSEVYQGGALMKPKSCVLINN